MRPITEEIPKALVEVNEKPLIEYVIDQLNVNSINTYVTYGYKSDVLLPRLANKVAGFINTNGKENAAVLKTTLVRNFSDPIVVVPCDVIFEIDFYKLYKEYINLADFTNCSGMIVPVKHFNGISADYVSMTDDRIITSIRRDISTDICASGIQIIDPKAVYHKQCHTFYEYWNQLILEEKLYCSSQFPRKWKAYDTVNDLNNS